VRTPLLWQQPVALARVIRADPLLVHEQSEHFGPPLHAAAELGLDEHVKLLLEAGADPKALDYAGRTALDCARLAEDVEASARVMALLEAAAAS
jgi:ankyrin repeat protein